MDLLFSLAFFDVFNLFSDGDHGIAEAVKLSLHVDCQDQTSGDQQISGSCRNRQNQPWHHVDGT